LILILILIYIYILILIYLNIDVYRCISAAEAWRVAEAATGAAGTGAGNSFDVCIYVDRYR